MNIKLLNLGIGSQERIIYSLISLTHISIMFFTRWEIDNYMMSMMIIYRIHMRQLSNSQLEVVFLYHYYD